ncbi:uncharacterized protein [Anoplolepis gracilipes]|uniref:uncharacterized protein n=1 Tax=Anoplolepis gracilipes TaxID=354296 RepID=UPI003BA1925E
MEHFVERYYKLNRVLLSITGLWPYQSEWSARLIRIIHLIFLLGSAFIQIFSILVSEITMEFIATTIPSIACSLAVLPQMYIRIKHIDKLRELLEHMWTHWTLQKTHNEFKIMHKNAEIIRLLTLYSLSCSCLCVIIANIWLYTPEILDIISPINESRQRIKLPYARFDFFIDEERYLYFLRFCIFIASFITPMMTFVYYVMFMTFTIHICAMCKLLGYRAEHLFCIVGNTKKRNLFHRTKIYCEKITAFVQLHNSIIQFIRMLDSCYTISCLLDLIVSVIVTSITAFQTLTIFKIEEYFKAIALTTVLLCFLFMINYMGQKVTNDSSNICEKVYNSTWYDAEVSQQKLLLLIMRRRFNPLVLTAWFYVFSVPNFVMILQTVVSYCMFIRKMER